jgi:hypothetical protein
LTKTNKRIILRVKCHYKNRIIEPFLKMWLKRDGHDLEIFHFIIDKAWPGAIIRKGFLKR